jgi:hypothetical protein
VKDQVSHSYQKQEVYLCAVFVSSLAIIERNEYNNNKIYKDFQKYELECEATP